MLSSLSERDEREICTEGRKCEYIKMVFKFALDFLWGFFINFGTSSRRLNEYQMYNFFLKILAIFPDKS